MSRNAIRYGRQVKAPKLPGPSLDPGAGADAAPGLAVRALAPIDPLNLNGDERAYADHLECRRLAGEVRRWDAHPEKFQLSCSVERDEATGKAVVRQTFYTPDFRVILADGSVELHEVKGHMRDDALVKIRLFVDRHPYPLVVATRRRKSDPWTLTRYTAKGVS